MSDQRVCRKRCVKNGIKCREVIRMLKKSFGLNTMSQPQLYECLPTLLHLQRTKHRLTKLIDIANEPDKLIPIERNVGTTWKRMLNKFNRGFLNSQDRKKDIRGCQM